MTSRKTVSDIYEAALIQGLDGFAAWGLQRLSEEFSCVSAEWQISETASGKKPNTRSQFVSLGGSMMTTTEPACSSAVIAPEMNIVIDLQDTYWTNRFSFTRQGTAGFTLEAKADLSICCEHLIAAEILACKMALKIAVIQAQARGEAGSGHGIADREGNIKSATPEFSTFMKRAQHGWDNRKLPFPFSWEPRMATHGMVWKTLFFRMDQVGEHYLVNVREDRRKPGVSEREFEIAIRVGKGMTFKEIAREIDLAPSTVSTHLYNLYAKLGISRRAHLVDWLNKNPSGGRPPPEGERRTTGMAREI